MTKISLKPLRWPKIP